MVYFVETERFYLFEAEQFYFFEVERLPALSGPPASSTTGGSQNKVKCSYLLV